jgi:hypothetical protein
MGLISLGLEFGIFCDFPCSFLLFDAILGLDFLKRALSRPQVIGQCAFVGSFSLGAWLALDANVILTPPCIFH